MATKRRKRMLENVQQARKEAPVAAGTYAGMASRSYQKEGVGTHGVVGTKKGRWQELMEQQGRMPTGSILRTSSRSPGQPYNPLGAKVPIPGNQGGDRVEAFAQGQGGAGGLTGEGDLATTMHTQTSGTIKNLLGAPAKEAATAGSLMTLVNRGFGSSAGQALRQGGKAAAGAVVNPMSILAMQNRMVGEGISATMTRPDYETAIGTGRAQYGQDLSDADQLEFAKQMSEMQDDLAKGQKATLKSGEVVETGGMPSSDVPFNDPYTEQMLAAMQKTKDLPKTVTGHLKRGSINLLKKGWQKVSGQPAPSEGIAPGQGARVEAGREGGAMDPTGAAPGAGTGADVGAAPIGTGIVSGAGTGADLATGVDPEAAAAPSESQGAVRGLMAYRGGEGAATGPAARAQGTAAGRAASEAAARAVRGEREEVGEAGGTAQPGGDRSQGAVRTAESFKARGGGGGGGAGGGK